VDWYQITLGVALVAAAWVYAATGWPCPGLIDK
jgi:hypothetical protein